MGDGCFTDGDAVEDTADTWLTPKHGKKYRRRQREAATPASMKKDPKMHKKDDSKDGGNTTGADWMQGMRACIQEELSILKVELRKEMLEGLHLEIENAKKDMHAFVKEEVNRAHGTKLHELKEILNTTCNDMLDKVRKDSIAQIRLESLVNESRIVGKVKKELQAEGMKLNGDAQELEKKLASCEEKVEAREREMKSWTEMAAATKKQIEDASPWIEVVKKNKGVVNTVEVMNATLEEEARRKARAMRVRVQGWGEKGTPLEDAQKLCEKMNVTNVPILDAWRMGDGKDARGRILMLKFADLNKKASFLAQRKALKGLNVYLGDDLTPAQVAHRNACMPKVHEARKNGMWAVYRDGRVIITERRASTSSL